MTAHRPSKAPIRFAVCVDPGEYPVSLERWKIYRVVPDPDAESRGQLRVVDESGEDYLYPQGFFHAIELPRALAELHSDATASS